MMATTSDMNGIPELQRRYSRADHPIKGISDLDGAAYRDDNPIPGSVQAFRAWHERGVPYAFVTNNSTKSAAQFAAKLSGMGIPATAAQVFNTISTVTNLLQQRWPPGTPVFAIGEQPLLETLDQSGYHLTGTNAEVVVLGFDSGLNYAKLRTAIRTALAGATIIATDAAAALTRIRNSKSNGGTPRTPGERGWTQRKDATAIHIVTALAATPDCLVGEFGSTEPLLATC
jgi:4-nitrophenyl phosphatase